jgi:lysophospholipase L1-like esterase
LALIHELAAWPAERVELALRAVGRVDPLPCGQGWRHQWPGTYFEARFDGPGVLVDLGTGPLHARISVDSVEVADVIAPSRRMLRIDGLAAREHRVRVDFVSENQADILTFGGFAVPAGQRLPAPAPRQRSIEFIGDSYTVGYGAASQGRECSLEEVWRTTDTSLAFGPQVARHFDADYRVMAISGRGMVRNYANGDGLTLPQAYARLLPGLGAPATPAMDAGWSPQLIVIGLGTNDFSTPVAPGEPWPDLTSLSAAFEARYVEFGQSLQQRHPTARFVLVATDAGAGAAEQAVSRVRSRLQAAGMAVEMLALGPLQLDGCDWHPSRTDQEAIARKLIPVIEAMAPAW